MIKRNTRKLRRKYRHKRVRNKIFGTEQIPRVSVFKSSKNIYAQVHDDISQVTICGVSTLTPDIRKQFEGKKDLKKLDKARIVGEYLGDLLQNKDIKEIRYDRSGYPYHGLIKALADGIREKGINF